MRRIGRHRSEEVARQARALSHDVATALFNASSRFRRQLQSRKDLEAIADAVVEHLRSERWQFEKRRAPLPIGLHVSAATRALIKSHINGRTPRQ